MMFFPINSLLAGTRKDAGYTIGPAIRAYYEMVMARYVQLSSLSRRLRLIAGRDD